MRSVIAMLLLVTACAPQRDPGDPGAPRWAPGPYATPSDELYDERNLPRFDLIIDEASLAALEAAPREWAPATLAYRGQTLSFVGVRLKGEYSFRDFGGKPSFKLKLDEFVDDQELLGVSKLMLNNAVQDPTFLGERLAYTLYREAGLPAPRANNALVYVNGEYFGLYANIEVTDKRMLARWFGSDEGNLYEETGADFTPGNEDEFELETNADEGDRRDLIALIAAVDRATPETFLAELEPILDVDGFLGYCALEALTGDLDGYAFGPGPRNNFRLYHDPSTGKFTFIPSGKDRALKPLSDPLLVGEWVEEVPVYESPWNVYGVILAKCVDSPACRAAYAAKLDAMATAYEASGLPARIVSMRAQIARAVEADARMELDVEYFDHAIEVMHSFVRGRVPALRAEL